VLVQVKITRVRVPKYVDVDVGGQILTLYPIEVMYEDGNMRKLSKRYSDVLRFHKEVLKGASHPALEGFNFPHKSMFNTSAEFTKERRRSGFEEYFELLLRLGPAYAPFIATFLKDEESFDELGDLRGDHHMDTGAKEQMTSSKDSSIDKEEMRQATKYPENFSANDVLALARPHSAGHWLAFFYFPVFFSVYAYAQLLTALGAIKPSDWSSGAAWLALLSSPLLLTVAFALLAPICDGDPEIISES